MKRSDFYRGVTTLAANFPFPALSIVEAYDTGFRAVEAEGKLPTMWGRMKAE